MNLGLGDLTRYGDAAKSIDYTDDAANTLNNVLNFSLIPKIVFLAIFFAIVIFIGKTLWEKRKINPNEKISDEEMLKTIGKFALYIFIVLFIVSLIFGLTVAPTP